MVTWEYLILENDNSFSGDPSKWIYHVNGERTEGGDFHSQLEQLGGKGWEMVGFEESTYVFKRPRTQTESGGFRQSGLNS
jgi:hypothetical protein